MPQVPTTQGTESLTAFPSLPNSPRPTIQPLLPLADEPTGNPDEDFAFRAENDPGQQSSADICSPDVAPKGPDGEGQNSPDSRDLAGATVPQDGSTDTGNEIDYKHPEGNFDDDVQNLPRDGGATMEQPTTSQDTKPDSEKGLYALVWPRYNPNCKDKGEGKPGIPIDNGGEPEELGSGGGSSL
ncbi:hypothetical protein VTO73DRAFT_4577 [Trametes versicolor]